MPGEGDVDRHLTQRGVRQLQATRQWLQTLGLTTPRVVASPFRRAQQSASVLTSDFETISDITPDHRPDQAERALQEAFAQSDLIVVTHQPLLSQLIERWCGQSVPVDTGNGFLMSGELLGPDWLTLKDQHTPT